MKNSVSYIFWVKKMVKEDPKKLQDQNELKLG